jgi:glycine betaine/proline transport system substrate-binding protein
MRLFSRQAFLIILAFALLIPVLAACADDDADDDVIDDDVAEQVDDIVEDDDAVLEDDDDVAEPDDGVVEDDDAVADDDDDAVVDEGGAISIGYIEGWSEGVAASYLWGALLEDAGYEVTMQPMSEAGFLYQGIASQDIDLYVAAWLPLTHENYWEAHEGDLEHVGTWYEEALLALSVPQYVVDEYGITSIADLEDNADLFDSTITGIEPGAGMMGLAAESVMPTYGIDDWNLLESSTAAMLAEWDSAYSNEEPIVVTLWEPHWAYAAWDIHNLEDPDGAWGDLDQMQVISWTGFSEEFSQAAQWLGNFSMEADEIGELMDYVTVQADDGEQMDYARQWLDDGGQDVADGWMN